uniref:Uncharacterized protein n=1 Tax=Anguilla anguilla TaxID=7936 RepID=A0A0E9Q493_ANGAN
MLTPLRILSSNVTGPNWPLVSIWSASL